VLYDILPSAGDDQLVLQAQAGVYRDIFLNSSVDIGWELEAGLIQPVDWLRDSELFADLPDKLWEIMTYEGKLYGVLQDMGVSPIFVNKAAMRAIGWTEEEIEALPQRVIDGDFTLYDMLDAAGQAVEAGAVQYGFAMNGLDNISVQALADQHNAPAYSLETNTLVYKPEMRDLFTFWQTGRDNGAITPDLASLQDTVYERYAQGEVAFFLGESNIYYLVGEASGMEEAAYDAWFAENNVVIAVPAAVEGGTPGSLANPRLFYVGPQVDEQKLPYVQRILELASTPEMQVDHVVITGKLPVTRAAQEDPRFQAMTALYDMSYMLEFTGVRPPHPDYAIWRGFYQREIENILVKGATADEAYENMLRDVEREIDPSRIVFE
jgi:inositol-phosphate transport system substrate-binding protein